MTMSVNQEEDYCPSAQATEYEDCLIGTGADVSPMGSYQSRVSAYAPPPPAPILECDGDPKLWPLEERPVIYVAGYYSANPSHGVANAVEAFAELIDAGWVPLVPHVSMVLDMLSPRTPEFWYAFDLALLRRCDAMYVCPDVLTEQSVGVAAEIAFAKSYDIPVFYSVVEAKDRYL